MDFVLHVGYKYKREDVGLFSDGFGGSGRRNERKRAEREIEPAGQLHVACIHGQEKKIKRKIHSKERGSGANILRNESLL